jgi:hypothetical protein
MERIVLHWVKTRIDMAQIGIIHRTKVIKRLQSPSMLSCAQNPSDILYGGEYS